MVEFYVLQIRLRHITLDDVPEKLRAKVEEKLSEQQ